MSRHLTAADRGKIEILHSQDFSLSKIAREVGKHKSTICRELAKRSCPNGYFADIAQIDYQKRRQACKKAKKLDNSVLRNFVMDSLVKGWSPESMCGRLWEEKQIKITPETIYSFIYQDKTFVRLAMYQYLRLGRKKRRKQNSRSKQRSKIPNRVSIHSRPSVVTERNELGHFEGDSVLYANKQAINTLVELRSGLAVLTKLNRKTAELTAQAMEAAMKAYNGKTITVDNGSEFARHEDVGVPVYFADPYSSWQRGANENLNGLLRAFLPKRDDISNLTQFELDEVAEELNNRPRKRLGWKTPNEVFFNRRDKLIQFYRCI